MTEHTDYGILDDVLNRAAEAAYDDGWKIHDYVGFIRTTLPVLVPAVRDDATRRIKAWICHRAVTSPGDAYNEGYQDALADLWEYLSATEEASDAK